MISFTITGDTHGEYGRLLEIYYRLSECKATKKYICVTGDFGYLFENSISEHLLLNDIEKQDFTFIVIPGNHENYREFQKYEIVDFHGARAHKVRNIIFYICRGEIFEIGDKSFFAMSGGNSIDKYMRKENRSWWREEMPTDDEYVHALENIKRHREKGKKIDYVLSHAAPLSGMAYLGKDHGIEEYPLNNFLEYIRELLKDECEMHFYGHLHKDKEMPTIKQRALWFDYVELHIEEN